MNRMLTFAGRNLKELLRDPLSYIFCLGFPLVMLVIMTVINDSIPAEANMTLFRIENLSAGIAVFGLTFIMLFTCLSVSKDRAGSFLVRLYASPMKSSDFIMGYILPVFLLSIIQSVITFAASIVVALITGSELNIVGCLIAVAVTLPLSVCMISLGLLFGTLFSEKAAPGLCSIIISLASLLGGIWLDVEGVGGVMEKICSVLPFFHGVKAGRLAIALDFDNILPHIGITAAYAIVITMVSIIVFRQKMKADLS